MKLLLTTLLTVIFFSSAFGQHIYSGDYSYGLKLSFDSTTKMVTGYFENYTGWDYESKNPKFSCIFYIEGIVTGQQFNIKTYYPAYKEDDLIKGTIEIVSSKNLKIKLNEEHGGCWNVHHFADEPAEFTIKKNHEWIQVRYLDVDKAFFHSGKYQSKRLKSYLVKGDFVCLERIEQDWAYCTSFGKKMKKGWLKLSELNKL
jgi:hypothetical protein